MSSMSAFSKLRKMSTSTSGSSTNSSSGGSSTRSNSFCTPATTSPTTPSLPFSPSVRSNSLTSLATTISPLSLSKSARNFSRHLASPFPSFSHLSTFSTSTIPSSPTSTVRILPKPTILDPETLRDLPTPKPEMSDIFSLGCLYLDILTFLLKNKLADFVKHRSSLHTTPQTPNSSHRKSKSHLDSSFHANLDNLDVWMTALKSESEKRPEPIFRAVPELLRLCKKMLAQNALLRPTARDVRDRIQAILEDEGGAKALCCEGKGVSRDSPLAESEAHAGVRGTVCVVPSGLRNGKRVEEAAMAPDVPRVRASVGSAQGVKTVKSGKVGTSSWKRVFTRARTG